jgi:hypothetical protein
MVGSDSYLCKKNYAAWSYIHTRTHARTHTHTHTATDTAIVLKDRSEIRKYHDSHVPYTEQKQGPLFGNHIRVQHLQLPWRWRAEGWPTVIMSGWNHNLRSSFSFFFFYFWVLLPVACIIKVIRSAVPGNNLLRCLFIYICYRYMFRPL